MDFSADLETINYLKGLATNLGIPDDKVGHFVAEELRKERREALEKERGKLEFEARKVREEAFERAEHEAKLARDKIELDARLAREEALLEHRLHLEAEESKFRKQSLKHTKRVSDRGYSDSEGSDDDDVCGSFRSGSWKPSLPKFEDETDDIDGYLKRFEHLAQTCKWRKSEWATILSTRLTGRAVEVYNNLSDTDACDYDKLKTQLLARYQLTSETYRRRFREYKKKDSETFTQMGTKLCHNFDKWFEFSKCSSFREMILLEQFERALDPDLAFEIRCQKICTLNEAAAEAQRLFEIRQTIRDRSSDSSSSSDESEREQKPITRSVKKKCYYCKSDQHLIKDCT